MSRIHTTAKSDNIPTRGWIRSNTKTGPALDVKIYPYEGRYCIVIMIESLFRDRRVSWVRIVNGINKYVSETSEEISIEKRSTGDKHGNLLQRLRHEQNLL